MTEPVADVRIVANGMKISLALCVAVVGLSAQPDSGMKGFTTFASSSESMKKSILDGANQLFGTFDDKQERIQEREQALVKRPKDIDDREKEARNKDEQLEKRLTDIVAREQKVKVEDARLKMRLEEVEAREQSNKAEDERLKKRMEDIERHAHEVQNAYAEQQHEKRRRTLDAAAYSVAYISHMGHCKGKQWQPVLEQLKRFTGIPMDRLVEPKSGARYPMVLLFVAAGSTRLHEIVEKNQVAEAREWLPDGGKLVLVVIYKEAFEKANTKPPGIDEMVQFSAKMELGNDPHKLKEDKQITQEGEADLKSLVKDHVPDPPVFGPDCLFKWLPLPRSIRNVLPFGCTGEKDEL